MRIDDLQNGDKVRLVNRATGERRTGAFMELTPGKTKIKILCRIGGAAHWASFHRRTLKLEGTGKGNLGWEIEL